MVFMTAGSDVSFVRGIDSWRLMFLRLLLLSVVYVDEMLALLPLTAWGTMDCILYATLCSAIVSQ